MLRVCQSVNYCYSFPKEEFASIQVVVNVGGREIEGVFVITNNLQNANRSCS